MSSGDDDLKAQMQACANGNAQSLRALSYAHVMWARLSSLLSLNELLVKVVKHAIDPLGIRRRSS